MDYRTPAFVTVASTRIEGAPSKRLMVALRTIGCRHARSVRGGCTFCGFRELTTQGHPVATGDLIAQFDYALSALDYLEPDAKAVGEIDLYNSGSFLDDDEVPLSAARAIFQAIAGRSYLRKILIESRPEFIIKGKEELCSLKEMLGDRILEVGCGLETSSDRIRLDILNKGFTLADFEEAAALLAATGTAMLAYVLLKPPGLSEGEAVKDVLATITWCEWLGKKLGLPIKIALQPMFVPERTPLAESYRHGDYQPPSLWSVLEILKATRTLPLEIEVALSDEGLSEGRAAQNCPHCNEKARELIASFNRTQERSDLDTFSCSCRKEWEKKVK